MDILAQLDELKYPKNVNVAKIIHERKERMERLFEKYENRSKERQNSISLEEFDHHYPDTNNELVENPHTRTYRQYLRQHGDLIDELTTVAGEAASDEEELSLSESESEEECDDFKSLTNDCDCKTEKNTGSVRDSTDTENNVNSENIKFREHINDLLNVRSEADSLDADDEDDFLYGAAESKFSNPLLAAPTTKKPKSDKPIENLLEMAVVNKVDLAKKKVVIFDWLVLNATNEIDKGKAVIDKENSVLLDASEDDICRDTRGNRLSRMTCTECGHEVTAVADMEDPAKFRCDDCWLGYDHGCDDEEDCEVCRDIAMWIQVRWEVRKQIKELDDGGREQEEDEELSVAAGEDNLVPTDDPEDQVTRNRSDSSEAEGFLGLTCTQCGVETDIPTSIEDPSKFQCDECLLGYEHGCDVDKDCEECREIAIWVQARQEVMKNLKGDKMEKGRLETLEKSVESMRLEDAE